MMISMRSIIKATIILFLLLFLLFSGCQNSTTEGVDFVFTYLEGNTRHLREFHGRVIVLDLMGVDCTYCFPQMFELVKIAENYSSEEVVIISIDVWVALGETATYLQSYIDFFKTEYDIDLDWTFGLDDTDGTLLNEYAPNGVPTMYIFDQKGNIYYPHVGLVDYSTLAAKIDELLK